MSIKKFFSLFLAITFMLNMFSAMPIEVFAVTADSYVYEKDGYTITYRISSEWDNNRSVEVTLKNTGEESILNWALKYDVGGEVYNLWNSMVYSNNENFQKLWENHLKNVLTYERAFFILHVSFARISPVLLQSAIRNFTSSISFSSKPWGLLFIPISSITLRLWFLLAFTRFGIQTIVQLFAIKTGYFSHNQVYCKECFCHLQLCSKHYAFWIDDDFQVLF